LAKLKLRPEDAPTVLEPVILADNTARGLPEFQLLKYNASQVRN
jgi:hypothetical protein